MSHSQVTSQFLKNGGIRQFRTLESSTTNILITKQPQGLLGLSFSLKKGDGLLFLDGNLIKKKENERDRSTRVEY